MKDEMNEKNRMNIREKNENENENANKERRAV